MTTGARDEVGIAGAGRVRADGTLAVARHRLARTPALGDRGWPPDQHDRARRGSGPADPLRARPVGVLAQLARAAARAGAQPSRARARLARLRPLADARR